MACIELQAVPLLGTGAIGAIGEAERMRLTAHVEGCAECREGLEALHLVERTLGACAIDPPSDFARRAMWKTIDAAQSRPRGGVIVRFAIPAMAIAALILLIVFARRPPPEPVPVAPKQEVARVEVPPPRDPRVRMKAGEVLARGALRIECVRDAVLELDDILSVVEGEVTMESANGVRVRLPDGHVETITGRVNITSDRGVSKVPEVRHPRSVVRRAIEEKPAPEVARTATIAEPHPQTLDEPEGPSAADVSAAADAARRSGDLEGAVRLYREVERHPLGDAYAEEAMLREARILRELGKSESAREVLNRARKRFPSGDLGPERMREEEKLKLP